MLSFLRDSTPEAKRRRYGDADYDWEHRVDTTSATVGWRDRLLGVFHSPYQPTDPALFHEMLEGLNIPYCDYTFLDLGSGKGRTLLMASDYPFRRILGVELLPDLHAVAEKNIREYHSPERRYGTVQSMLCDATQFAFPIEPILLYLFDPLPESALRRVIHNLEESLRQNPRPVTVLYHNPLKEHVLRSSHMLRRAGGTHQYAVYVSTE